MDPEKGLTLTEIADGVTVQEIVEATGCEFEVSVSRKRVVKCCLWLSVPACAFAV